MRSRFTLIFLLAACAAMFVCLIYVGVYQRYIALPKADATFLSTHPSQVAVLERFANPEEVIHAGERFTMTGWYPLPDRAVTMIAMSFLRPSTDKIYVFFGADGKVEYYVVARS